MYISCCPLSGNFSNYVTENRLNCSTLLIAVCEFVVRIITSTLEMCHF